MLRLIGYIIIVAPLAYGALWLAEHPGQVTMDWFGYRVTTSLAILIGMIACLVVAFVAAMMLLRSLLGIPSNVRNRGKLKRQEQGLTAITRAMAALAIADHRSAEKQIGKAQHLLGKSAPAPLLLSAQLSHAKGERGETTQHFKAMLKSPETRLVGLRGMIDTDIRSGNMGDAVNHAREAWSALPSDRWLSLKLLDLLCRTAEWSEAIDVIRKAEKKRAFVKEEAHRYTAIIHYERARIASDDNLLDKALELCKLADKQDHGFVPAQLLSVDVWLKKGDKKQLARTINHYWKTTPHTRYVSALFDAFADEAPAKFYKRIEKLTALNPDHIESQLAMARVAIHQAKWDVARNYLKVALTRQETPRIYEMLAEVEKAELGDDKQASEWLRRALNAPRDASWHCTSCNHIDMNWHLHCPECGSFDSAVWHVADMPASDETETLLAS